MISIREIYEGDIVKVSFCEGHLIISEVTFQNGGWCFDGDDQILLYEYASVINEVIGNIHDNPELLKNE